jgi:ribosomal protein S18 acetylase RimI-like enzyme
VEYKVPSSLDQSYLAELSELYKPWTDREYDNRWILTNSQFVLAYDGDLLVGAVQLIVLPDPFRHRSLGLVENVFVKKEYRRRGIAFTMMNEVERLAKMTCHCEYIKLNAETDEAKALYRNLGYEENSSFRMYL